MYINAYLYSYLFVYSHKYIYIAFHDPSDRYHPTRFNARLIDIPRTYNEDIHGCDLVKAAWNATRGTTQEWD